MRRSCKAIP
ncbi:hypothetical protein D046_8446, partial [Vibrio parahaemolyticus V-223/04]